MSLRLSRRGFIRAAALTGAATSLYSQSVVFGLTTPVKPPGSPVRLGFIGLGVRGRQHLRQALSCAGVSIPAICEPNADNVARTNALFRRAGRKSPAAYTQGEGAFEQMLQRDDLDGVVIALPWHWHTPVAVAAMRAGKYAAVEVSATATLQDSWALVDASEQTGMPCMLLENVCYRRDVLAVLNMVRQGRFGDLSYVQCGYQHHQGRNDPLTTDQPAGRPGDPYSAHGLGPVAHWLNINRGNRFVRLTSTATKSRGLRPHPLHASGVDQRISETQFTLGEVVTTTLECANGETVALMHDTPAPRPYSLGFRAQGTRGTWLSGNDRIGFTSAATAPDHWAPFETYQRQYEHPLWQGHVVGSQAPTRLTDHGPIDQFVLRAFIDAVRTKGPVPIDVYDAATWSAIGPLSEISLAQNGQPVEVPDFTRGKWPGNPPIF